MTSPHSPYHHPGPGPSTYYHHSPPPTHPVYGNHSMGPAPNHIQYSYNPYQAPPPHMNSQHSPMHQQPVNNRVNGRGGNYSSRGAHSYQNYHQPQQQFSHPHGNPALGVHSPHPQHPGQHNSYQPDSAKYNQPYAPYPYHPSNTAAPYSPSWQAHQPLSPLPKQLSMPPPREISPYYDLSTPVPPSAAGPEAPVAEIPASKTPTAEIPAPEPRVVENSTSTEPAAPKTPTTADASLHTEQDTTPSSSRPSTPSPAPTSSYSHMGTISTANQDAQSSTDAKSIHQTLQSPKRASSPGPMNPVASWAIWSRRPQDPSHAPSIIFSPRARPPANIVEQALDAPTPPASPSLPATELPEMSQTMETMSVRSDAATVDTASTIDASNLEVDESFVQEDRVAAWSSRTNSTVPSSAVTENNDTPTVPGSPASTNTSLSMVGTPSKDKETAAQPTESSTPAATESPSEGLTKDAAPIPTAAATEEAPASTDVEVAPAEPAKLAAHPVKKSWASLLSTPGASKNALPKSSVVGFSIPASSLPAPSPAIPVSPSKKTELINLLTTGPGNSSSPATTRIRPRGLVNSGNMCFANSVLQILVYCPPFQRLFLELGRLLPGEKGKDGPGVTPLLDATVGFLKEFLDEEKEDGSRKMTLKMSINGSGGSEREKGKGKERQKENDEDDWDGDSFIPSNVYDAMKEKKRFDNMRGGHQEDAEEFLGFYLDTLEEELLATLNSISPPKPSKSAPAPVEEKEEAAPPEDDGWLEVGRRNRTVVTRTIKAAESPITRIFGGKFRSTLRSPGQKDSVIVEDWRSLRLDIQREQIRTIEDALSYISHPQPVQVSSSARPSVTVEASQQVLIDSLPPILVLHLKRFCYDTAVGGVVKVGKQVRFGPELEIGPDLMAATSKRTTRYKLFGALYHHGQSASGGHYTLDVLHPNRYPSANPTAKPREGWVRIDDELVSDVRPDDVFNISERDDRCAYLLFYRRVR